MTPGFSIKIVNNIVEIHCHMNTEANDNLCIKNDDLEIAIEGLVLNKKKLLTDFALSDFKTLILELYHHKKENFIKELDGEFRGYVWNKKDHKVVVFTNPTATQRVFYTKFGNKIWIDSSLIRLAEGLKSEKIKLHPNIKALYQLLCVGNILENECPIQDVYKISDGRCISIDIENQNISEHCYYSPFSENYYNKSFEKGLLDMHEIFGRSVEMEYEKDLELQKKSLALLSGGLDSRVGMMYALQKGFDIENILCFSQSRYWDHKISEQIAKDYRLHYEFIPLDGGEFLNKIDQLTKISEGCGLYTGGVHVQYALDKLKYENFGVFHSGQIGDGILGGFNSEPHRKKPSFFKIIFNDAFLPKVEADLKNIMGKYETEEAFLLKNIAYNRTVLGAQVQQQKAYQTSPFMSKEMLNFSFSLKEDWKYKHRFYLEWIKTYCPEATEYRWERTLLKPDAAWKTKIGDQFLKPIFKKINEKILNSPQKSSMYPYAYYFEKSEILQSYYQNYFTENLWRLENFPELKTEMEVLFSSENFFHKCQAVNVLAIFKLYF